MTDVTITHEGDDRSGEYRAEVKGSEHVGRLTWTAKGDGVRAAEHTLVPPPIGGQGIAMQLVEAMVADAKEEGFRIRPDCSYVARKFEENPDWSELRA